MTYLSSHEIAVRGPDSVYQDGALKHARCVVADAGYWNENQQMGRRWAVACVALEITQRCNLDCTLCYLSETAELVKDLPLDEVFRRIDLIRGHYGANTDVQITGGEPTLRDETELLAIVRKVRASGMRATLMTNGIRARRPLLERLAEAGLSDVAFHVDTTQELAGYSTEMELNTLRERYLELTHGLPLSVMFNTSVHSGNLHEIPDLVEFFIRRADQIRTASFQLQADVGRSVLGHRDETIFIDSVLAKIQQGANTPINFDACRTGSPECNRYALCFEVNGKLFDLFRDTRFFGRMQHATTELAWDRTRPWASVFDFLVWLAKTPRHLPAALHWAWAAFWAIRRELIAACGRMRTLSFFVHNFMDSCALDAGRIDTCVFKAMTSEGPLSMCLHNAKRDCYVLPPIEKADEPARLRQPLSGEMFTDGRTEPIKWVTPNAKHLRGRHGLRALRRNRREAEYGQVD
jgi:molybdenum cofactor biosynthesis enzyme MoaA